MKKEIITQRNLLLFMLALHKPLTMFILNSRRKFGADGFANYTESYFLSSKA